MARGGWGLGCLLDQVEFCLQFLIILLFQKDVLFLLVRLVLVQDHLDDFHAVLLDFLDLVGDASGQFSALLELVLNLRAAVLHDVLLEVVVHAGQQLDGLGLKSAEGGGVFNLKHDFGGLVGGLLALGVLANEHFGGVHQRFGLLLDGDLKRVDFVLELPDQLELLHHFNRLGHVQTHLLEGHLQEAVDEEADVLDAEDIDGVIAMVRAAG